MFDVQWYVGVRIRLVSLFHVTSRFLQQIMDKTAMMEIQSSLPEQWLDEHGVPETGA